MPFIIFGVIVFLVWNNIRGVRAVRKLNKLGESIRENPSNKKIKEYITLLGKMNLNAIPSLFANAIETYRQVSILENIDYDIRAKLCETLRLNGAQVSDPKKPTVIENQEREQKIRQAGEEGEKQVGYALKWLDKDKFKIFSNIRLSAGGESQEFDTIVVGDKAVFNIETKNYIGDLTIDQEGNWYRIINGNKSGTQNPIFQIKRHNVVLNNILEERIPIVDLIVWTNVESVIEGAQYSPVKVIKVDQLTHFIESYKGGKDLSREEISFALCAIERNIFRRPEVSVQ